MGKGRIGRTADQIRSDRATIAGLYLRGMTQAQIGQAVELSQPMICEELKAIRKEWVASSIRDFDEAKAVELAKLDAVERAYWSGWQRSRKDEETIMEETSSGEKESVKSRTVLRGQSGDPRFLDGVRSCIAKRCDILGLNAPTELVTSGHPMTVEVLVGTREEAMTVQELLNARAANASQN